MTNLNASSFEGRVDHNKDLASGANSVVAVVSIKSNSPGATTAVAKKRVLGFVADGSGSMDGAKWKFAKQAVIKAVEGMPEDGNTYFFVIMGGDAAHVIVDVVLSSAATKRAALARLNEMTNHGGTYFARWLAGARAQFDRVPGGINILSFLTDGKNEGEDERTLNEELKRCVGKFEAECRGVGEGYKAEELRTIQKALGGSVDGFQRPEDLIEDFKAVVERTQSLSRSNVLLQIWTPVGVKISTIKQMTPQLLDLTGKVGAGPNPRLSRVDTGAWGEESRDYMIVAELAPEAVGKVGGPAKLVARVSLVENINGAEVETKLNEGGQITAEWTDDDKKSTVINPKVANYTGQAELARNIQEGVAALTAGDEERATKALGKARELAVATGNDEATKRIDKIVKVDPDKGTVKIIKGASAGDVVNLDTASTRTRRVK
jgi:hypothetical protein